jgi:RimJ/RimL family protein N-acetyltransferase
MITMHSYQPGDAARIPVAEADPFAGWIESFEQGAGLTSYKLDGQLLAVTGYAPIWDGVADAVALIDRELATGHGKELAKAIRWRIDWLMQQDGLHRIQATSEPHDKASRVFLRAIGYKFESVMECAAPDGSDLLMFVIIGRKP